MANVCHRTNARAGLVGLAAIVLLGPAGCQREGARSAPATTEQPAVAGNRLAAAPSDAKPQTDEAVRLEVLDQQGLEQRIAGHRGKVVVLDIWSTSCPPCMREFPGLVRLHQKYGPDRLACVSLSIDYEGGEETLDDVRPRVLRFLRRQHATFDNVLSSHESLEMLKRLGIYSIPAVFVYNQAGELVKRFDSSSGEEFTYQDVEAYVRSLLDDR